MLELDFLDAGDVAAGDAGAESERTDTRSGRSRDAVADQQVDAAERPVGLVHVHDLLTMGVA